MIRLVVAPFEIWDEESEQFLVCDHPVELMIENSLVAISKWETKYEKQCLGHEFTNDEFLDYVRFMVIDETFDTDLAVNALSSSQIDQIKEYLGSSCSATRFKKREGEARNRKQTMTSEMVYWQLLQFQIPFSVETWNINRILTLIKICNDKSKKGSKMSTSEIYSRNRALNEARRAKTGSRG